MKLRHGLDYTQLSGVLGTIIDRKEVYAKEKKRPKETQGNPIENKIQTADVPDALANMEVIGKSIPCQTR